MFSLISSLYFYEFYGLGGGAMSKIKVLVATPLKGDISPRYFRTALEVLGPENPHYHFTHVFMAGTCVFGARDQLACMAIEQGMDILLFWDADLRPTIPHFARLLALVQEHDFVCMPYSKREHMTHWHFFPIKDADIRPDGLWEVEQAAIGFSAIKVERLKEIQAKYPERGYWNKEQGVDAKRFYQFFPWEVRGPNTAEGKIERIQKALVQLHQNTEDGENDERFSDLNVFSEEIEMIINDSDFSQNKMIGEDYGFCRIYRSLGRKIWIDAKMVVTHTGECDFPIPSQDLVTMVGEEWRQGFFNEIKKQKKQ